MVGGSGLAVYAGNDDMLLPVVELGGAGVISVASHLVGEEMAADRRGGRPRRPRRGAPPRRRPERPLRRPLRHHQPHSHQGRAGDGGSDPVVQAPPPPGRRDARAAGDPAHGPRAAGHSVAGLTPAPIQEDQLATATRGGVRVIPLGGAGEIGKNMYVIEYEGRMVVLDCGITFPKNDQMGVDIVLPDFGYVVERRDKLEAIILTHGHEDHIGAVPFLLRAVGQVPIYGRRFTLALVRPKLEEHRLLDGAELVEVPLGRAIPIGPFEVEFVPLTHSTPDCAAVALDLSRRHGGAHRGLRHRVRPGRRPAQRPAGPGAAGRPRRRTCCWPTPRTPRRARRPRRCPRATCATSWRASSPSPTGACWSRPSPPTSTASSRCWTPRTPTGGPSRSWAARSRATSGSRPT